MNNYIEAAAKLLDLSGAQYFIAHDSLDTPLFGPKKHTKLVAAEPIKTLGKRPYRAHTYASKWRALLADIPMRGSKALVAPKGMTPPLWQARVAAAACKIFGKGQYTTHLQDDGSVMLTRK